MKYKLYSADLASRLYLRSPYLEGYGTLDELHEKSAWRFMPSVITNEDGNVVERNRLFEESQ